MSHSNSDVKRDESTPVEKVFDPHLLCRWISVEEQLPTRKSGKYGDLILYCKLSNGSDQFIDLVEFVDWQKEFTQGYFVDSRVTHWLSIEGIT
jgi:hypothetical protein